MRSRTLTEPIHGRCAGDGTLISADPPLLRLHLEAGGEDGGVIALPQLLGLCRLSRRIGMKLARVIDVTDADHDYRLLVETDPDKDGVSFQILAWTERVRSEPVLEPRLFRLDQTAVTTDARVQIDAGLRVIAFELADAHAAIPSPEIGMGLTEWLRLAPDEAGRFALLEAIAERQPFKNQMAQAKDCSLLMSGQPLLSGTGEFAGYICHVDMVLEEDSAKAPASFPAQLISPSLRQPLNRIIANAETIHGRLRGPIRESYAGYARDIASAASHLKALVDDFGDLESIDRPGFAPEEDQIDCCELARRAAGLLSVRAADHGMAIHAPDEGESLFATGEYRRVLQILVNLVGNAVRYSPDGSEIQITTGIDPQGRPAINVEDQGGGIAAADRERVFEKFERLGRSGDGGSGLGLYISRRLARAMGGDLTVTDGAAGARFELSLPPA